MKCQGNPVSCYGKRSSPLSEEKRASLTDNYDYTDLSQEINYERALENLIESCKNNVQKSCSTILRIMLMNSSN